ncbi:hypothetical protein QTP86_032893 [Hemibagrus guttatus]|nr:hypothetical protein QTP86_032893 [Hemibagrus guttatus]
MVFILIQNGNAEECTKDVYDRHYSCEGRNLTYIPTSIPSSVEKLDFSFNLLPSLQKHLFPPLYDLQVLDLTRCQIQFIADDAFHNVKNVTTLILTGNPISYTAPDGLNSLHKLKRLVLADTGLLSLNVQFNNLTKLQELNVGTNMIQTIALPQFMMNFKDFCKLDLHANKISSLKVDHTAVLREMKGNITLILSSNPILHIELGAFRDIYLKELNIQSCVHIRRLTIALCIFAVIFLVFVSLLAYKFQFYLRYGYILLRGYRASRQQEWSYDAFVIYSSKDEAWVMDELVENLENGNPPIHLCLHVRDFEAGKAITSNIIDEGIMGSRKTIVVVSKHFMESSWCRFEFEVAQSWLVMERNANIIIIILEEVEEEKSKKVFGLHKHLKNNTYLKWSENPINNMTFWIRLRKAVITRN